jgi:hypothetical protein
MKTGRLVAVCINATMTDDDVSEAISQPAPASCIQVPMFDPTEAIQRARKSLWRNGLHADALAIVDSGILARSEITCVKAIAALRLYQQFIC